MSSAYTATSWRKPSPTLPPTFPIGQLVTLPLLPRNSIVNDQRHITKNACNHPLAIVGMRNNGKTATLIQTTSFGGTTIDEKYHNHSPASRARKASYLAINHENTKSHTEYPPLKLAFDTKMDQQSYINLDQFFNFEAESLVPWKKGQHRLDSESISILEKAFLDFVNGIAKRPGKTNDSVDSPFDYWSQDCLTASYLGVNDRLFVTPLRVSQAVNTVRLPSLSPATPRSRKATRTVHPAFGSTDWRARSVGVPS